MVFFWGFSGVGFAGLYGWDFMDGTLWMGLYGWGFMDGALWMGL
jgi:hypothetical protein